MMTKSAQAKIADHAGTMGFTSVIFPIAGMSVLGGADDINGFWLKCAGIVIFGALCIWNLQRIEMEKMKHGISSWAFCLAYFAGVFAVVAIGFESIAFAAIVAIPEVLGFLLCSVGLIHAISKRTHHTETDAQQAER